MGLCAASANRAVLLSILSIIASNTTFVEPGRKRLSRARSLTTSGSPDPVDLHVRSASHAVVAFDERFVHQTQVDAGGSWPARGAAAACTIVAVSGPVTGTPSGTRSRRCHLRLGKAQRSPSGSR